MSKNGIEIPGDAKRDKRLEALVKKTGFGTVNRLLTHVANELSRCGSAAEFYRVLAAYHDGLAKQRKPLTRAETSAALLNAVRILKKDTTKL